MVDRPTPISRQHHAASRKQTEKSQCSSSRFSKLMKEKSVKGKTPSLKQKIPEELPSPIGLHGFPIKPTILEWTVSSSDFSSTQLCKELSFNISDFIQTEIDNGISTTTIAIQTEDAYSPFNGMQVEIKHYDTAPQSFTINFNSSAEALDPLNTFLADLQKALTLNKTLSHFDIHLSPPALLITEKSPLNKGKKIEKKAKKQPLPSLDVTSSP